jgi:hypothetical protein
MHLASEAFDLFTYWSIKSWINNGGLISRCYYNKYMKDYFNTVWSFESFILKGSDGGLEYRLLISLVDIDLLICVFYLSGGLTQC